jgi:hypothetical protein
LDEALGWALGWAVEASGAAPKLEAEIALGEATEEDFAVSLEEY